MVKKLVIKGAAIKKLVTAVEATMVKKLVIKGAASSRRWLGASLGCLALPFLPGWLASVSWISEEGCALSDCMPVELIELTHL